MILGCYVSRCVRTNRRSPAILSGALSAGRRPQLSARPFVYVDHLPKVEPSRPQMTGLGELGLTGREYGVC